MITLKKITTSNISEVRELIPDYDGGNVTRRLHPDGSLVAMIEQDGETVPEPYEHISGNRIDVYDKGLEVIEPGEYDDDGNETKLPVYGDRIYEIEMPE